MDERGIYQRGTVVLFATVFLFAMWGDGYGLHSCPHHDVLPVSESDAEFGLAHDHGDSLAEAGPERASEHASHEGPCTCMGDCDPPSSADPGTPSVAGGVVPAATVLSVSTAGALAAAFDDSPYRLPFPNAPPPKA
jgi:hypothetical protein